MSDDELVPLPDTGRRFTAARKVRLGDANIHGRLRLDALARFLQDVANDDARDALGEDASSWVVRRSVVDVRSWPRFGEVVELTTFLGGVGARWAERRTTVRGTQGGGHVECASIWVHIDFSTGRPAPLPESFLPMYGAVYGDRKVSGRLTLPSVDDNASRVAWHVRATDFDVLGHVNNAAYWEPVEEALLQDTTNPGALRAQLEYKLPIEPHHDIEVARANDHVWLVAPGTNDVHAAARVNRL